jgi:hypothetical protein
MEIPSPVEQLDEAHVLFNQSSGKQAIIREAACTGLGAVGCERFPCLAADVHHFRNRRLHAECEFVLSDPGHCFRMTHLGCLLLV